MVNLGVETLRRIASRRGRNNPYSRIGIDGRFPFRKYDQCASGRLDRIGNRDCESIVLNRLLIESFPVLDEETYISFGFY